MTEMPLKVGDSVLIAAHRKHRVEVTDADTIWLALFLKE